MARTSDPHGAAVKAWETRGRAQNASTGGAQRAGGDWAALMQMHEQMGTGENEQNPPFILGAQHSVAAINRYLAEAGATMQPGSPLPPGVKRGKQGACYENATHQMITDENYDYAEGFAFPANVKGMAFMHAWLVDKRTGKVVDTTWEKPEGGRYYGVRYDRKKYLKHIMKTRIYGVLGGDFEAGLAVMGKGGL